MSRIEIHNTYKIYLDEVGWPHREDGPAYEWDNGNKWWVIHNNFHREDGPAVEEMNIKEWWINGKLHREDGPAIEHVNGIRFWYINGKKIPCSTQEEFECLMKLELFW